MKGVGSDPSILVLMPALNEEEGIGPTIEELRKHVNKGRVLVVDGYSKDKTAEIANDLGARVFFRENEGKGDAMAYAISRINEDLDYLVLIDADYTYPAEFIPEMIRIMEEEKNVGMVCGNRFNSHFQTERMSDLFYLGNRILAFTHNLLNGVTMRDPLSGLRVIRWSIVRDWKPKSKGFDIEVEMNHRVEDEGYGISEIDIPYRARLGEKKLKARHGFQILKRMMADVKI
jgi:dolichol-phosphate mannosyltransferase